MSRVPGTSLDSVIFDEPREYESREYVDDVDGRSVEEGLDDGAKDEELEDPRQRIQRRRSQFIRLAVWLNHT